MHSRLEHYLKIVEKNLSALSDEERHTEVQEIRLHMESLLEANREICPTEEAAITETLAQFGRAHALGKDLTHVHQSRGRTRFDTLPGAIVFHYLVRLVLGQTYTLILRPLTPSHSPWAPWLTTLWILGCVTTALLSGGITGGTLPRSAVKGTLYAHLLGACLGLFVAIRNGIPLESAWTSQLITVAITSSLAMLGAKLGARWHDRRVKKIRLAL